MTTSVSSQGDGRLSGAQTPPPLHGQSAPGSGMRDEDGAIWSDARHAAESRIDQQKQHAADGMGDVAAALRDAARRRRDEGDESFARLTSSAADGLERLSGTLRNKDLGAMLRDVNSFARSQPAAFFGLALLAGFAATRFLKASQGPALHAGSAGRYPGNEPSASEDWQ